jgi:hypothetical protein
MHLLIVSLPHSLRQRRFELVRNRKKSRISILNLSLKLKKVNIF